MFNNDVTQNYNQQDATFEILIMLAGAFILGWIFSWLLRKLYSNESQNTNTLAVSSASSMSESQLGSTTQERRQATQTGTQKPVVTKSSYGTPRIDDLTKINGVDANVQEALKGHNIRSYTDLRDIDRVILKDIAFSSGDTGPTRKDVETWPHQASLAAKGEWKKLTEYQAFIQRSEAAKQKSVSKRTDQDDLKKIEGIGPKIEEILNHKGIFTFKELNSTESDTLKSHIVAADSRFKNHNTESWPHQAGMAEKGQWEELDIYQEFMDLNNDSKPLSIPPEKTKNTKQNLSLVMNDTTLQNNEDISSINKDYEKLLKEDDVKQSEKNNTDDLKKIEGIGPKIEALLNQNNISTFKSLHLSDRDTLKGYLDHAGPQFRMHEPDSWPHQAGMADRGEWKELTVYQDFLDGGREHSMHEISNKISSPDSDLKVTNISSKSTVDDLKKIEGIGPKIEELLKSSTINSFKALMACSRDQLKEILDNAGPQYRMHEPETWPEQAKMAFNGEWDKLKEYQDFLLGGRE